MGFSVLDSIETAISRHISFSAHDKLADVSFPNWGAVLAVMALPLIVAELLVFISRPKQPARLGWSLTLGVAWFHLGLLLGGMVFGGYDLGLASLPLSVGLAWAAVRLCRSRQQSYQRLVRGVTLVYLALAPGALPALFSGTFLNGDFRPFLHKAPRDGEVRSLCAELARLWPKLGDVARQRQVSIRLATGSLGPLAELYEPVIGPTTIRLDHGLVESDREGAAASLAHELMHLTQHPRRLPGIIGVLLLDLENRELLEYEKGVARIEVNPGAAVALPTQAPSQRLPMGATDSDLKAFYPEYKYSAGGVVLRRFGAAVLLIAAYLLWPRLCKWTPSGKFPSPQGSVYRREEPKEGIKPPSTAP